MEAEEADEVASVLAFSEVGHLLSHFTFTDFFLYALSTKNVFSSRFAEPLAAFEGWPAHCFAPSKGLPNTCYARQLAGQRG